ncbi:methyl-accepting chemotaxis protein [Cohnella panacarvi]|uniref:methyl-accepting chemotaxis protein n=1 Tax=Cohnella panacarvi TaxID=400776 RepID=UPI00047B66B7|nr:HAMP domain-containing methyl-accepting chemotaxis protein [Cohnella panacarvi]
MKITNISVKTRLLLMLFVPLVLFACAALYLVKLNSDTIDDFSKNLYESGSQVSTLVLNADRDMYQAYSDYLIVVSPITDAKQKETAMKDFDDNLKQIQERLAKAQELSAGSGITTIVHPESKQPISEIAELFGKDLAAWIEQTTQRLQQPKADPNADAEIAKTFESARNHIDKIEEIIEQFQLQTIEDEKAEGKQTTMGMYIWLIVEWIVLIVFGMFLIRQITRTINQVREKAQRVYDGFLDKPAEIAYTKDELGSIQRAVDGMIVRMRDLIGSIADNARSVQASTNELGVSANESTNAASHVAENIQEVTTLVETQSKIMDESSRAMEEMTIGVQRIAESTGTISQHANDTNKQAEIGNELLVNLKSQMELMSSEIERLNDSVTVLNEKSAEIGAITENITGFANQTGILSLNASIEAARAGEHGRGFAVVAGEIRKLAASSLESANSINDLVSDTRAEIDHASGYMRSTLAQVQRSAALMQEVSEGFASIVGSIRQVAEQIHETSSVTEQMSASSQEVAASIDQSSSSVREVAAKSEGVAAATEEQLALVESIARSADQLNGIVRSLNAAVEQFKL